MRIRYINYTWPPNKGDYKNELVLYKDNWNDFGYQTTFHLVFCDNIGQVNEIGDVKIYDYNLDKATNSEYIKKLSITKLPSKIHQLSDNLCSLGQSLTYYKFKKIPS